MAPRRPRSWIPTPAEKANARARALRRQTQARDRAQDLARRRQAVIDSRVRPLNNTELAMIIEIALAVQRSR